jgi:hypothetical protein
MEKLLSKALATTAVALGLGLASLSASAVGVFNEFTVDEGSVPGNSPGTFVADKINGAYSERITFDGMGGFAAAAFADFGQYLANDGTTLLSTQLNVNYGLYALFESMGTVTPLGFPPGSAMFTGTSGAFQLFLDPDRNTTKTLGATGSDPITVANNADDILIAFATNLTSATGVLIGGVGGFFDLVFADFTLTPAGGAYFIAPSPFHLRVNVDGDFDNFSITGTQTVTGDVSAVFVPEPGTLALVGVSLLGLGGLSRIRRARA